MNTSTVGVSGAVEERNGLIASEHEFETWDGARLFYRAWRPDAGFDKIIVLLHRGHEHSARWEETARNLGLAETAVFAWDERGHGRSPGERGWAENFSVYARDLDAWVRHLCETHAVPAENVAVVAHSVAAVIAASWVHDYAPRIRALVLATPAFRVKLYVPLAIPGLRLLQRIRPRSFIKSYVGGRLLTHDPQLAQEYDSDKAISRNIAVNILLDLFDTSSRLIADAGAIQTPALVLSAGSDLVVREAPQRRFFERLCSPVKEFRTLPGFHHAIFHETGREEAVRTIRDFLRARFEDASAPRSLLNEDEHGYTRNEYERLSRPLAATAPKAWWYALQAALMNTLGRLSRGVSIGWRTGFDSGESLDAVYENQPAGLTPIGRWIDRAYLNAVGWKGIRLRKAHLQRALEKTLRAANSEGRALRVLDIAAGPGRYLLETIQRMEPLQVEAICRDRSTTGLAAGRALAEKLGIHRVSYQEGDAFSPESLASVSPQPTIAIVSGLYELFPGNAPIRTSLAGLRDLLPDGGWLIYTNQPWHPQVEMIARVLPNRDGKPWVMRRRTQAEMDELVRAAGFEKLEMEIDPWGIFTVSIARRKPAAEV